MGKARFFGVVLAAAGMLASAGAGQAAATPVAAPASGGAASGGAASGGAVIVVLKDQHANLSLHTQGSARNAAARGDQRSVLTALRDRGARDVRQLVSVNAVAASGLSAADVRGLAANPAVARIEPDSTVRLAPDPEPANATRSAPRAVQRAAPRLCPANPRKPMVEPEALDVMHVPAANKTATGKGVVVAVNGINDFAGHPDFQRADGSHVIQNAPDYTKNGTPEGSADEEWFGDASSIAAQGRVVYDYAKEFPYSGLPAGCTFTIHGDAPDASLVDLGGFVPPAPTKRVSEVVAGLDDAVVAKHADVVSESYNSGYAPGEGVGVLQQANDAIVASGVTVTISSGDSGRTGTVGSEAMDPLVISVGGTNTLRNSAQAYGYADWRNNTITPLSSSGTTPNNRGIDLVAPGYGGEAACSPTGDGCPANTQTEAFGGTSQSCPFVAGAAADVIQAYAAAHNGTKPTPAQVKSLLTGTATDTGAPADEQGAGLVNVAAAVDAARQAPGTAALIPDATQVNLAGAGGSTQHATVRLRNTGAAPAVVNGTFRALGAATPLGATQTEKVTAPDPAAAVPAEGAQAGAPMTFTVPAGLDQLNADMIWPDQTNSNILSFTLTDPKGRLTQISYDYGSARTDQELFGSVPDIGHVDVAAPTPGTWKVTFHWANGRAHLQEPPNTPGTYRGTLSFRATGQHYVAAPASAPVTIPAHGSAAVPVNVALPTAPGDNPGSIQFAASNGAATSLPVTRRTLVPAAGSAFAVPISSSVGRGLGGLYTFNSQVPAGRTKLTVTFRPQDLSPDNTFSYALVAPNGKIAAHKYGTGNATLSVPNPAAGRWEIDVYLDLTTSGKKFDQPIAAKLSTTPAAD